MPTVYEALFKKAFDTEKKKKKKPNDPPHGDVWIERGNTKVYNIGVDPRKAFC